MTDPRGTRFESMLEAFLRTEGYDAERLPKRGVRDEGDLILKMGGLPFIVQAKDWGKFTPGPWVNQAAMQSRNYANARVPILPHPNYVVIAKRRNHAVGRAFVITELHEWLKQVTHE